MGSMFGYNIIGYVWEVVEMSNTNEILAWYQDWLYLAVYSYIGAVQLYIMGILPIDTTLYYTIANCVTTMPYNVSARLMSCSLLKR